MIMIEHASLICSLSIVNLFIIPRESFIHIHYNHRELYSRMGHMPAVMFSVFHRARSIPEWRIIVRAFLYSHSTLNGVSNMIILTATFFIEKRKPCRPFELVATQPAGPL